MHMWVQNLLPLAVGKSSTPALRDTALQFLERYAIFIVLVGLGCKLLNFVV
jgi:hypothetical protein